MNEKNIITTNGKHIDVFDDIFSYTEADNIYYHLSNGFFKVNGTDNRYNNDYQIYSNYSLGELASFGFLDFDGFKYLNDRYGLLSDSRRIIQIRTNFSTSAENNKVHCDSMKGGITFLYYLNPTWDITWGGHTLFLNETLTDVEYTSLYTPNRAIVFDGSIPHLISTPNSNTEKPRLSLAIQLRDPIKN